MNIYEYMIAVGERSHEFTYPLEILLKNIGYFQSKHSLKISPYYALLNLYDSLTHKEKEEVELIQANVIRNQL